MLGIGIASETGSQTFSACACGQNAESRLEPDQWASPATRNRHVEAGLCRQVLVRGLLAGAAPAATPALIATAMLVLLHAPPVLHAVTSAASRRYYPCATAR